AYDAVFGDGAHLYTAPGFPDGGDNAQAHGPGYTVAENGTTWSGYNTQTPRFNGVCNGPVQMAYDPVAGTLYSVNWDAGIWRLAVGATQGGSTIPTPTT